MGVALVVGVAADVEVAVGVAEGVAEGVGFGVAFIFGFGGVGFPKTASGLVQVTLSSGI